MSVTFSVTNGRRQVRDDRRRWSRSPPPVRSRHYYSGRESSPGRRRQSPSPRARSPPTRLQIVIPNDLALTRPDSESLQSSSPPASPKRSITLTSRKFQVETGAPVRSELRSKNSFRVDAVSSSKETATGAEPATIATSEGVSEPAKPEPAPQPTPIVSSRRPCSAFEAGNGSQSGVLLVQNLPHDVTGREIVVKLFPEHDIVCADLFLSDGTTPHAEITFPRLQDAIGALQRHNGQVFRGHALKITLLNSYKI